MSMLESCLGFLMLFLEFNMKTPKLKKKISNVVKGKYVFDKEACYITVLVILRR